MHDQANRVDARRILHQVGEVGIEEEALFRRSTGLDVQVVETDGILLQDIVDRIVLACRYLQVHIRKERLESRDVDHRIALQLPGQPFVYLSEFIRHRFDIRITGQHDPKVAGVERNTGRIFIATGMQRQCLRMEFTSRADQFPVTESYIQQVILAHIRFRFGKKLEGGGKRIVHQVHAVQVEVLYIGDQHGFDLFLVKRGVQRHIHLGQRIMAEQVELQEVLFQRTVQLDIRNGIRSVFYIADLPVHFRPGRREERIISFSLCPDSGGQIIKRVLRQEIGRLQAVDLKVCFIRFAHRIIACRQFHFSLILCQ